MIEVVAMTMSHVDCLAYSCLYKNIAVACLFKQICWLIVSAQQAEKCISGAQTFFFIPCQNPQLYVW
jgi:hypothetical protein